MRTSFSAMMISIGSFLLGVPGAQRAARK